jgi:hypothetical protein
MSARDLAQELQHSGGDMDSGCMRRHQFKCRTKVLNAIELRNVAGFQSCTKEFHGGNAARQAACKHRRVSLDVIARGLVQAISGVFACVHEFSISSLTS